ncbi:MAG: hypothetical protein H7Y61_10670 [Rhizobiales bacterium]|nr:hypothetical protein [Rhizobacter sp.]
MKLFGPRHDQQGRTASERHGSSFFLDSTADTTEQGASASDRRPVREAVIVAIALAVAFGIAGLFGLLRLVGA